MRGYIRITLTVVVIIIVLWLVWEWGFCRFYVYPNQMAIITTKTGESLPEGQILAKSHQKGIQEAVLGEGRHFLNPILCDWEIKPMFVIPPGKIGKVTSKVGENLPEGEFLADEGEKGIRVPDRGNQRGEYSHRVRRGGHVSLG